MRIYSTCQVCGFLLLVADASTHPHCDAPFNPLRDLEAAWLQHVAAGDDDQAAKLATLIDEPVTPRLREAAMLYAQWGWAVFPLAPGLKTPLTRNGFKDATTDSGQIDTWWKAQPQANIGLPTGRRFDVIDIDAPEGWASFLDMSDADAIPDIHGKVSTPSGGAHLYVKPAGAGNRAGMLPGVDYRGDGGYVVAPPSVDAGGRAYIWQYKPSPIIADCGLAGTVAA